MIERTYFVSCRDCQRDYEFKLEGMVEHSKIHEIVILWRDPEPLTPYQRVILAGAISVIALFILFSVILRLGLFR